jgi:hypothetical protein
MTTGPSKAGTLLVYRELSVMPLRRYPRRRTAQCADPTHGSHSRPAQRINQFVN